jgi:hypothetical protein
MRLVTLWLLLSVYSQPFSPCCPHRAKDPPMGICYSVLSLYRVISTEAALATQSRDLLLLPTHVSGHNCVAHEKHLIPVLPKMGRQ